MKHYIVVGNHKMNLLPGLEESRNRRIEDEGMKSRLRRAVQDGHTVVVCPPFVSIARFIETFGDSGVGIGAQNCHWESSGAFTGEISASMLAELGCTWVIVGHSERRRDQHETDELIGRKANTALVHGLRPIICIGETLNERSAGKTIEVLHKQIDGIQSACGNLVFDASVIAYEPVWAIGTGLTAMPEQIEEAHLAIRDHCRQKGILDTPIMYGGSVSADNAQEIFSTRHVSGALIGGASLSTESFCSIVETAMRCARA